eukprot:TRINITY_DN13035_c0_g1_i1.p1 TRINITY_DN13035_c0_g1~~TRINITY_DN13035_c0_g1_i1.p1  ORF type:complete len:286 (+),score=101.51 TRINITY_DN13035_c0_g1_i1:49-906(+)
MDNIRKKMQTLKYETDSMLQSCSENEQLTKEFNDKADQCDCEIRDLTKRISKMEGNLEETSESLIKATTKLEEKEKDMKEKEEDLSTLSRRVILLEDEVKKSEIKLASTTLDLAIESKRADKVLKAVNTLNSKAMAAEVEIEELSKSEREAKGMWMDSERKHDEISRRVGVMEEELRKAVERVENSEKRTAEIEEELKVVGENMIDLEKAEEKALCREEKYKDQIDHVLQRLKMADARAEYGEMNITKLNQRIDSIEDDIIREKIKIEGVAGELSDTFDDMMTKY